MYLSIGNDMAVRETSIIGIFDLDNTSTSRRTREFLEKAEKEGEVALTMPKACKLRGFLSGEIYEGKEFTFHFAYNQTELFEVIE
jgi:hypothetical protein